MDRLSMMIMRMVMWAALFAVIAYVGVVVYEVLTGGPIGITWSSTKAQTGAAVGAAAGAAMGFFRRN